MKFNVSPTVDCVFKALLGSVQNTRLLIHFLNAVLALPQERQIVSVQIENPYSEKEFFDAKAPIVDVKATDSQGTLYQIEMQLLTHGGLKERIWYTFCNLVSTRLKEGEDYKALKPVVSIWLLGESLLAKSKRCYHAFEMWDAQHQQRLAEGSGIYTLELSKTPQGDVTTELERWMRFFREGEELDDESLPEYLKTVEMKHAMETLRSFSEKGQSYDLYQARLKAQRIERAFASDLEELKAQLELAQREKDAVAREKDAMAREKDAVAREKDAMAREKDAALLRERALRQMLREAGLEPPTLE